MRTTFSLAFTVADAFGKLQSGILSGNLISLGNFDECLSVRHTVRPNDQFQGQYCLMQVQIVLQTMNLTNTGVSINAFGQYGDTDAIHRPQSNGTRMHPP